MAILEKYTNRNSSVELLRLWFMLMIVTLHTYAHGSGLDYDFLYSLGSDWSTFHHLGLFSLGKCGVTGFMFISGYYGISLKWNKLALLVSTLLFYLIVLFVLEGSDLIPVKLMLHPWDSWWFIGSYIVICVLAPLLNKGIESLSKTQFRNIVLFMIFYEYVGRFLSLDNSTNTTFLLTIFLIARYIRLYITPPREHQNKESCRMVGILFGDGFIYNAHPVQHGWV